MAAADGYLRSQASKAASPGAADGYLRAQGDKGGTVGTGGIVTAAAALSGAGTVQPVYTGTGGIVTSAAALSGAGTVQPVYTGTGGIVTAAAALSGAGAYIAVITGSGGIVTSAAALSGNDVLPLLPVVVDVQCEFEGRGNGWTSLGSDVLTPIRVQYGINGGDPLSRVASSGSCTLLLNNSSSNTAGVLGFYSPAGPFTRYGFGLGTRLRVRITDQSTGITRTHFVGRIVSIAPETGSYRGKTVQIVAADWFDQAARATVRDLATEIDSTSSDIATLLINNVPGAPESVDIDTGGSVFPFALDTARDDTRNPVLQELARVTLSEYGWCYQRGNGTVAFKTRLSRANLLASDTFNNSMSDLQVLSSQDNLVTRVQVITHPRTVDSSPVVLYQLQSVTKIDPSATVVLIGGYTDPTNRASRVGGTSMITPVSTTDYTMNSQSDGLGTDLTGSLTIVKTFSGNSARLEMTNTASVAGYITFLRVRGVGIYDYEQTTAEQENAAAVTVVGEQLVALDMPYQSSPAVGNAIAASILSLYKPQAVIDEAWILGTPGSSELGITTILPVSADGYAVNTIAGSVRIAPRTARIQSKALTYDIGDIIKIQETVSGVDQIVAIQSVALDITAPGYVWATWGLAPSAIVNVWALGTAGYSELGETTLLG